MINGTGIGHCGLCGTDLQRLGPRPAEGQEPGMWIHADFKDTPGLAALKAHVAIVHDDQCLLPPLYTRWPIDGRKPR